MKDSLIGINEGIEELTLTLLIGIKADLFQFILYPDTGAILDFFLWGGTGGTKNQPGGAHRKSHVKVT